MIIADLHIHSRFSRACSKNINLENLEKYARIKGITLLGTGDFTHPEWIKEIKTLKEENGILYSKTNFPFLIQTEISLMYTQGNKGRRIHFLILAPNLEIANQITEFLKSKGRVDYDGRPIFGFSAIELVENMQSISKDIEIIPAHIWTSYFGILGSKSGFNSIEECFQEKTKYIHAIETGISSDPQMNWRVKSLDKFNCVSFSDLHSYLPWRIGREATVFNTNLNYKEIINSIRTGEKIDSTIETIPDYGKYHYDGHRNCNISFSPEETKKHNSICPVCKKPLTIGVQYRVEQLANRDENYQKPNAPKYHNLIPLTELIAKGLNISGLNSKTVWNEYNKITKNNSELDILIKTNKQELLKTTSKQIANLILKTRNNQLKIKPGYDGEYGEIINDSEKVSSKKKNLFDF